jgi:hypothetical protein
MVMMPTEEEEVINFNRDGASASPRHHSQHSHPHRQANKPTFRRRRHQRAAKASVGGADDYDDDNEEGSDFQYASLVLEHYRSFQHSRSLDIILEHSESGGDDTNLRHFTVSPMYHKRNMKRTRTTSSLCSLVLDFDDDDDDVDGHSASNSLSNLENHHHHENTPEAQLSEEDWGCYVEDDNEDHHQHTSNLVFHRR